MKWRIYYDNGSGLSSLAGDIPPPDLRFGVICILQKREDGGYQVCHGKDFYLLVDDYWLPCDHYGMTDWVVHHLDRVQCVVVGRTIPEEAFRKIHEKAQGDRGRAPMD